MEIANHDSTILVRMGRHMDWADSRVIEWIIATPDLPGDYLRLMSHILNAESIWFSRILGKDYDRDRFKLHAPTDLHALNRNNRINFSDILRGNTTAEVDYQMMDGSAVRSKIDDILIHVFSHGFHHYGQMAALNSKSGLKFPELSYFAFSRLG